MDIETVKLATMIMASCILIMLVALRMLRRANRIL